MSKKIKKPAVYKVSAEIGRDTVVITLPRKAADYLQITENEGNELFATEINNVIQITSTPPNMSIPLLSVSEEGFLPHDGEEIEEQPEGVVVQAE